MTADGWLSDPNGDGWYWISDYELGGALGAYTAGWAANKRREEQNDK